MTNDIWIRFEPTPPKVVIEDGFGSSGMAEPFSQKWPYAKYIEEVRSDAITLDAFRFATAGDVHTPVLICACGSKRAPLFAPVRERRCRHSIERVVFLSRIESRNEDETFCVRVGKRLK